MKKSLIYLSLGVIAASIAGAALAQRSHPVGGHIKKDGTYVPPHQATNPNSTKTDNWSTKGNTNPYTGKEGTVDPFKPTPPPKP